MPHKLKVTFEAGVRTIELDGQEINTVKAIMMKSSGHNLECQFTHNAFGATMTSQEGEIEFVIPDSLAEALKG